MRISDWSSDVCSSDLGADHDRHRAVAVLDPLDDLVERLVVHDLDVQGLDVGVLGGSGGGPCHTEADDDDGGHGDDSSADRRHGCSCTGATRSVTRRSEEHTSELQSLMRISYAVFCLKKKKEKK